MWAMYVLSFKLLCPTVKEEIHLQENTLFDYDQDLGVKGTQNVIQYPLHHVTNTLAKLPCSMFMEEMHLQENTLHDLLPRPWGQGHTKCFSVSSTSCDLLELLRRMV